MHVQHLSMLPKILEPHWNPYVPIGAPKWHGPEEQDSRWFEPLRWKSFAHISTAPVEFNETWLGDASGAYIVTGAQLGVWDFGLKSVLHLKLLYLGNSYVLIFGIFFPTSCSFIILHEKHSFVMKNVFRFGDGGEELRGWNLGGF